LGRSHEWGGCISRNDAGASTVLGSRFSVLGSRERSLLARRGGADFSPTGSAGLQRETHAKAPRRQEREGPQPSQPPRHPSFSTTGSSVSKTARPSQTSGHCAHATTGCPHETARFPVIQRHLRPFSRIETPETRFSTLLGRGFIESGRSDRT
jgi:hypothetical protein